MVFRIGEANTNDIRTTPIPYNKAKEIRRLQVKAPARKYSQAARRGTGCHGILGTCRALRRLQVDNKSGKDFSKILPTKITVQPLP